jgi:hypothetical protein
MDPRRFMAGLVPTPHIDVLQSWLHHLPYMIISYRVQAVPTLAKVVEPQMFQASRQNDLQYAQPKIVFTSSDKAAIATRLHYHPAGLTQAGGSPDIFHNDTADSSAIVNKSSSASRYFGVKAFPAEGVFHVFEDGHLIPV